MSAPIEAAVSGAPSGRDVTSLQVRGDGVAVLTIDDQEASLNTITEAFGQELSAALDRIESDASTKAAVIISGKPDSFVVGANIDALKSIKFAQDAERTSRALARLFGRIAQLSKPVVAAVHGPALGGGFELALACHAIILSTDKKTVVGLPEVQLGLLPGANGLLRVAERAGLQVALDLGLTGKNTRAEKAKALGLAEDVCARAILLDVASAYALSLLPLGAGGATFARQRRSGHPARPRKRPSQSPIAKALTLALEENPLGRHILFRKAREATRAKTHGNYPATGRIIDVVERYGSRGFAAAAELEARLFGELVVSETAHRLIEVFFAQTALKKDPGIDEAGVTPRQVLHVSTLGGGLMGGGIAYVTINAGIPVRLKERDDAGLGRGLKHVRALLDERVRRRAILPMERDTIFARLTATTDFSGLKTTDVVIEAVFEDLALKQEIVREVEAHTKSDCVFASNTSSIPVAKIAEASSRPETVLGMHYFSPVHKMPLLEVIRTADTAPWAVATAVALGKKQGKTVIVVKDGVGFFTSRILAPYMNEAAHLVAEGVPIDAIDQALVAWGWPVGPIQLADEVGIDVAAHVGEILNAAFGDRMVAPSTLGKLLTDGRKGRKNGRGFYFYGSEATKGGKRSVDRSVYEALSIAPKTKLPVEEIQMRCSLQMVNEAILCFGDEILRSARDGDVGAIFGLGFPPFRGGPFRYVDTLGAAEILRRVQGYNDRFGNRWAPAPLLVEMAKSGGRFYES